MENILTFNTKYDTMLIQQRKGNRTMQVYVVMLDGAYGAQIEKIFTHSGKAQAFLEEQRKLFPCYCFYIETHWAI